MRALRDLTFSGSLGEFSGDQDSGSSASRP
jgi:hypothetical protein